MLKTAFEATIVNDIFPIFCFNADGLHQTAAIGFSVARININVFGPQAPGTMVGISVAPYFFAAILANEIFGSLLKSLSLHKWWAWWELNPHELPHTLLKRTRLPIPPHALNLDNSRIKTPFQAVLSRWLNGPIPFKKNPWIPIVGATFNRHSS